MSGHSKWSKIKHQKEATDATKGKLFTKLANSIIVAIKQGGGVTDPQLNLRLRLAIEKAKKLNMPKEKIEKAIARFTGSASSGSSLEEVIYEGFGPSGVGILIEAATDNKQRTVAKVKNVLEKSGGVLAAKGAVSHLFSFLGLIKVDCPKDLRNKLMEIAIEQGAVDLKEAPEGIEIYTETKDLHQVKEKMEKEGFTVSFWQLCYRPKSFISVEEDAARKILTLLSNLEDLDDIQRVFANFNRQNVSNTASDSLSTK